MRTIKGQSALDKYRQKRWMEDWPTEAPFPGMECVLNRFNEAVWCGPVKIYSAEQYTQEQLQALIPS